MELDYSCYQARALSPKVYNSTNEILKKAVKESMECYCKWTHKQGIHVYMQENVKNSKKLIWKEQETSFNILVYITASEH